MIFKILLSSVLLILFSCEDSDSDASLNDSTSDCNELIAVDSSRGECSVTLNIANEFSITISGDLRKITANNIPAHDVGLFGNSPGALNPNSITEQNSRYDIDLTPSMANSKTYLLNNGPAYSFGILLQSDHFYSSVYLQEQ